MLRGRRKWKTDSGTSQIDSGTICVSGSSKTDKTLYHRPEVRQFPAKGNTWRVFRASTRIFDIQNQWGNCLVSVASALWSVDNFHNLEQKVSPAWQNDCCQGFCSCSRLNLFNGAIWFSVPVFLVLNWIK